MKSSIETTIDAAGRLVVPKAIRQQAGIGPGDALSVTYRDGRIEIEPTPGNVLIHDRHGLRVAEPAGACETLSGATVDRTRDELRESRKLGTTRRK